MDHETNHTHVMNANEPERAPWGLWLHALFMVTSFLILLPIGFIMAIRPKSKSRNVGESVIPRHAKIQLFAFLIAILGILSAMFSGHHHHDDSEQGELKRDADETGPLSNSTHPHGHVMEQLDPEHLKWYYAPLEYGTAKGHVVFGWILMTFLLLQIALGVMQKSNIPHRALIKKVHKNLPKFLFIIPPWFQVMWGVVAINGWCYESRNNLTGQCVAHFIKGPAFLMAGLFWFARYLGYLQFMKKPNEFYESIMLILVGVITIFTEHRSFSLTWNHTDQQHTIIGVAWIIGGILSIQYQKWNKRQNLSRPNLFPPLVLLLTGFAMSMHDVQATGFSRQVHKFFGLSLVVGSLCRILAILSNPAWEGMVGFWIGLAGLLLGSATEEGIDALIMNGVDPVSWTFFMASCVLMVHAWLVFLLRLYDASTEGYQDLENRDLDIGHTVYEMENRASSFSSTTM